MSTIRAVAFGIVSLCVATVVACGGAKDTADYPGGGGATPQTTPAPTPPQAAIIVPAEGDSVSGDSLKVTMNVMGAKIVPVNQATSLKVPLEGHLHLFIDKDVTPLNVPIPMGDAAMVHLGTGATEYVIPKLAKGPHRIIVVFAFTDHSPEITVAMDTVNFIVR